MQNFFIYSDGGARGNPGPAGIGIVIIQENLLGKKEIIKTISEYVGETTNNQAEYRAILRGLEELKNIIAKDFPSQNVQIHCYLDSELIVRQMTGEYKIKSEGLKPLFWQIRSQILDLGGNVSFEHIPRSQNSQADKLVNEAIDRKLKFKN